MTTRSTRSGGRKGPPSFSGLRVSLAGPDKILERSFGEVKTAKTIHYRTFKPEPGGLFCQKIFGPLKDYVCNCGERKGKERRGAACGACGVDAVRAGARRERFGHIALAAPVAHAWFLKGRPGRIADVLGVGQNDLERVLAGRAHIVVDPQGLPLERGEILSEGAHEALLEAHGKEKFTSGTGGWAVLEMLKRIDLGGLAEQLRDRMNWLGDKAARAQAARRLKAVEAFRGSGVKPESMMLTVVPVLPPGRRPLKPQVRGRPVAVGGLNERYRRVIDCNNRLKRLLERKAPALILRNEQRKLQEAVDALFLKRGGGGKAEGPGGRPLKSLGDVLKVKREGPRRAPPGKGVDHSGRAIVAAGPELGLHQCGLPKKMALELFKLFVCRKLVERGRAASLSAARRFVEAGRPEAWGALKAAMRGRLVLVSRAPALPRLRIQAFEPVPVEGEAVRLHPLACAALGAGFGGDRVAVHVPLSVEALGEARALMMSTRNLLSPANGRPAVGLTQDAVLGLYYATRERPFAAGHLPVPHDLAESLPDPGRLAHKVRARSTGELADVTVGPREWAEAAEALLAGAFVVDAKGAPEVEDESALGAFARDLAKRSVFAAVKRYQLEKFGTLRGFYSDPADVCRAHDAGEADLHAFIAVRRDGGYYTTTVGRCLVGEALPPWVPFHLANKVLDKKALGAIVDAMCRPNGGRGAAPSIERLCSLGLNYATRSGMSLSIDHMAVPPQKRELLEGAHREVEHVGDQYQEGLITDGERYNKIVDVWANLADKIAAEAARAIGHGAPAGPEGGRAPRPGYNPLSAMLDSGACEPAGRVRHLAGMRGVVASPSGEIIETPVTSNLREGLSALEYFVTTHGARRRLVNDELKAPAARALTRKLVDVARDVVVTVYDCNASKGVHVRALEEGGKALEPLTDRILGRVLLESVVDPLDAGAVVVPAGAELDEAAVASIERAGVEEVAVRSALACEAERGVCALCYGRDLARGRLVDVGEAVGVVAAQSLGEPGLRLAGREPRQAGAGGAEASTLKAETDGVVRLRGARLATTREGKTVVMGGQGELSVVDSAGHERGRRRLVYGAVLHVGEGERVRGGQPLAEWDPHTTPILADVAGVVKYGDLIDGVSVREKIDNVTGLSSREVVASKSSDVRPRIAIRDEATFEICKLPGSELDARYLLPVGATIVAMEGDRVGVGAVLAREPGASTAPGVADGLARLDALFEAERPKSPAVLSEIDGEVSFGASYRKVVSYFGGAYQRFVGGYWRKAIVTPLGADGERLGWQSRDYDVSDNEPMRVRPGDRVRAGDPLTAGQASPHDVLRVRGKAGCGAWLVDEVQRVYRAHGVDINDKHVEIIVRQMLARVRVVGAGDARFVAGECVDGRALGRENRRVRGQNGKLATAEPCLLGVTEAARLGGPFLGGAPGLQATMGLVAEAAIAGRVDDLCGITASAVAGRLMPAGSGFEGRSRP